MLTTVYGAQGNQNSALGFQVLVLVCAPLLKNLKNPGLRLVASEDKNASSPLPRNCVLQVERSAFIAEVFVSKSNAGEIYHYVIQRKDSPDILHWGQEVSMQRAEECIEDYLAELARRKA